MILTSESQVFDRRKLDDETERKVGNEEEVVSGTAYSQPVADRRKLFRRLMALAGLGITGVLLSQPQAGLLPKVHAADMVIDAVNSGTGTTELDSSVTGPVFTGHATGGGAGSDVGVFGRSESTSGEGVQGYAAAGSGSTIGVFGRSDSTSGEGVSGYAAAGSGFTDGVFGQSDSTFGTGVRGFTGAGSGTTYGVHGQSNSTSGRGVQGYAAAGTGATYGVYGQSDSTSGGTGVLGLATGATGIGVEGHAGIGDAIPMVAKGAASQVANLQEWQDSLATALTVVDPTGRLLAGSGSLLLGGDVDVGNVTSHGFPGGESLYVSNGGGGDANNNFRLDGNTDALFIAGHSTFGAAVGTSIVLRTAPAGMGEFNRVTVDPNGNVGVGTGSPARAVHLQGNNAAFRMDRDVNSSAFILVRTAPGDFSTVWKTFYVGVDASGVNNGLFFIGDVANNVSGASTRRLIINNTGLVGVGRTPTANNLEVEGTASKTAAGSWLANSDMRIKTNIQDLEDPLGVIEKLHPVRFQYTQEYRRKHPSIGDHAYYNFIAQEYRDVFPDSVQDDGEGLLQMDSYNSIPFLVAAVQQLKSENEQIKAELETLRQSIKPVVAS